MENTSQTASVAEVLQKRPVNVLQACILQTVSAVMTVVSTMGGYTHYVEMAKLLNREVSSFEAFLTARGISVLMALVFAYLFYAGKNWARLFFIGFFLVTCAMQAWSLSVTGSALLAHIKETDTIISILQFVIAGVVCGLLVTQESRAWFSALNAARAAERNEA